ncbi:hypothetical protein HPB52_025413 [Rhipicephalus sanguineus]|uniref:HTH CENPB-type domain-containing protein n=1 Tax=Rhipicephalus sanguineus TaxID=34632 RepID=A0A9D4TD26_RHISA|nr:hypothetical protein HPB52_025413 [Rhipicephalus sanguineus]
MAAAATCLKARPRWRHYGSRCADLKVLVLHAGGSFSRHSTVAARGRIVVPIAWRTARSGGAELVNGDSSESDHSMAPTKRCHHSAAFKRKVVLHAEKTSNLRAQQEFGVHEKNVRRWRKQRAELFGCAATRMAFTGPKTGRHHAVEEVVADMVREQREAGMPVTTEIIQAKAREVAIAKSVSRTCFKASRGWTTRFMKRFGFSLRRRTSI